MNYQSNVNWNNDVLNIMNAMSFVLGVMNLELNQKQASNDDLDRHLANQDKILNEQTNDYLEKILKKQDEIISLLKERRN